MPSKHKSLWIRLGLVKDPVDKHYDRARMFHKQSDLVKAIREYEIVLKLDPNHALAHYYLGVIFAQQHHWNSATHELEQAQALGITQAEDPLSKIQTILSKPPSPQQEKQQVPSLNTTDAAPKLTDNKNPGAFEAVTQQVTVTASQRLPDNKTPMLFETVTQQKPEPLEGDTKRNLIKSIDCPNLDQVFAPGGPVSQLLQARYRPRSGQVEMANLVRDALKGGKHAVIEAGTGIGKSFAYLVPIVWSGAQAIVSTSNKALMDQLWDSDIPKVQKIAPKPFVAALLKGRSNYICALRLQRFREKKLLPGFDDGIALIEKALQHTPSGDHEQMKLPPSLLEQLIVSQHECEGINCAEFQDCFYERAKTEALQADIILTNHALLCYSILHTENRTLPVRPVLVVDEAHQLEEFAISALTQLFEHKLFWALVNNKIVKETTEKAKLTGQITDCYNRFFQAVKRQRPDNESDKWALTDEIQEGIALWSSLKQVQGHLGNRDRSGDVEILLQRCENIADTVHALAYVEPKDHIRYCEINEENGTGGFSAYSVQNRPLEISDVLKQHLFRTWPRVICTSATLSVVNNLGWFQRRIGVSSAGVPTITTTIPSPYNYPQQMLLYTPSGIIPTFNNEQEEEYVRRLVAEVERLIQASKGRAFVLCTSRKRMEQLHEKLAPRLMLNYPCYCQGDMPRSEIVSKFKQDGNAVLFATRSFWEGIDIPGEALSLVILDKVPFQYQNDPVLKRYEQIIKSRGGDSFEELQLSYAILMLRQGAGRLIRSEEDRGVIALLDSRILTKRYGEKIIQSLPAGCHVKSFEAVQEFFSVSQKPRTVTMAANTSYSVPDEMNALPRRKLCEIITQYEGLVDDTRRCKALLNDLCGEHRREINLLITAQEERVASDLQNIPSRTPLPIVITRLVRRLVDNHAVTESAARWAVESWTMALGLKSEEK